MTRYCLILISGLSGPAAADGSSATQSPPLAGRPENFTGAIGRFRVSTRAEPTELHAEEPLRLTLRITGAGNLRQIRRPDLHRVARFAQRFHIEDLDERWLPDEQAREFDYGLRPRDPQVTQIPPLPFVYFQPDIVPDFKGYQTTYAPAIPVRVLPHSTDPTVEQTPSATTMPESAYQLATGTHLLRRDEPWKLPSWWTLLLPLVLPPCLCVLGGWWWLRRHPDAARQVRLRRSRAARKALQSLTSPADGHDGASPRRELAVLTAYFQEKVGLKPVEPTAEEVAAHLLQEGASVHLTREIKSCYRTAHEARFAPALRRDVPSWSQVVHRLILKTENESWPHS